MTDLQTLVPTKLLWMDLEMTGLDPAVDVITEVAVIVTDFDFNELGQYEAVVKHDKTKLTKLLNANDWYTAQPEHMQNFIDQNDTGKPEPEVENELCAFVTKQFGDEPAVLAGNSIHNDRLFIQKWWPAFNKQLHYRMLDVTSFKILMMSKYNVVYEKSNSHRALDDIRASINELRHYIDITKVEK